MNFTLRLRTAQTINR